MRHSYSKYLPIILFWVIGLLVTCVRIPNDQEQASVVLTTFFSALEDGNYGEAVQLYGGSYETLAAFNPDLNPDDHITLWKNGCQINGLQCLSIHTTTLNELTTSGEFIFTVEFSTPDGKLFVLEACCGENPSTPPQFQFEYRVVKDGNGKFRVLDMPVFLP
jgi:hypothetical protein